MKQACIEKICNLPLALKQGNQSMYALLKATQFEIFQQEITTNDITQYLQNHLELIETWEEYSDNKRTSDGYYYRSNVYGAIAPIKFEKSFPSKTEACAEYILKEISSYI